MEAVKVAFFGPPRMDPGELWQIEDENPDRIGARPHGRRCLSEGEPAQAYLLNNHPYGRRSSHQSASGWELRCRR
jgi:hypothetical protein